MRRHCLAYVPAAVGVLACGAPDPRTSMELPTGEIASPLATASLTLRLLDVTDSPVGGQAVLLSHESAGRRRHVLIDAGERERTVLRQLRALGVDSLALVVLTHPHTDHYGGLLGVFPVVPVSAFAWSGDTRTLESFTRLLELVDSSGARPLVVDSADRAVVLVTGNDTLRLALLAPMPPHRARRRGDPINNRSVGVLVSWRTFSALVPGDAEHPELSDWMRRLGSRLDVDVLVASHHGSRDANSTARSPRWYRIVTPRALLISANGRQHPIAEVLDFARANGIPTYCTSVSGSVVVRAVPDGSFDVRPERHTACRPGTERPR